MTPRTLAFGLACGRIGFGAAFLLAPGALAAGWTGRGGARPAARVLATGLGVRDLVLGVGTAFALSRRQDPAVWLRAGAAADAGDVLATLRGRGAVAALPAVGITVLASGATALGLWLARELAEPYPVP